MFPVADPTRSRVAITSVLSRLVGAVSLLLSLASPHAASASEPSPFVRTSAPAATTPGEEIAGFQNSRPCVTNIEYHVAHNGRRCVPLRHVSAAGRFAGLCAAPMVTTDSHRAHYDERGRVTRDAVSSFLHGEDGHAVAFTSRGAEEGWRFDDQGRVLQTPTQSYTYDEHGRLEQVQYPEDSLRWEHADDGTFTVRSVRAPEVCIGDLVEVEGDPLRPTREAVASCEREGLDYVIHYTWDERARVTRAEVDFDATGEIDVSADFSYDCHDGPDLAPASILDSRPCSLDVIRVTRSAGERCMESSQFRIDGPNYWQCFSGDRGNTFVYYAYDDHGRLVETPGSVWRYHSEQEVSLVTMRGTEVGRIDGSMRLTRMGDLELRYDAENRISTMTAGGSTVTYAYTPSGVRAATIDPPEDGFCMSSIARVEGDPLRPDVEHWAECGAEPGWSVAYQWDQEGRAHIGSVDFGGDGEVDVYLVARYGCHDERELAAGAAPVVPRSPPGSPPLSDFRRGLLIGRSTEVHSTAPPALESTQLEQVSYPGPLGEYPAYASPVSNEGSRPAIIWIAGGFDWGIHPSQLEQGERANDQGVSALMREDIVLMVPALRGTSGAPGVPECFLGEVDDIIAAAEWLLERPDVDPTRVYLGGHSTGGTLALLAAASFDELAGVFSFGPVADPRSYGSECPPAGLSLNDYLARAPRYWASDIETPTWMIEGARSGNAADVRDLDAADTPALRGVIVPGHDHFSVLRPGMELIADQIVAAPTGNQVEVSAEAIEARQ